MYSWLDIIKVIKSRREWAGNVAFMEEIFLFKFQIDEVIVTLHWDMVLINVNLEPTRGSERVKEETSLG